MRGKSVLIIGGAGFIGSNLAEALSFRNTVTVLDDLSTGSKHNLAGLNVEFVKGSMLNKPLVNRLCKGRHYVFLLAAMASVDESIKNPERCFRKNVMGSHNVLRACVDAGVEKFIFSSSAAVYGNTKKLPISEKHEAMPLSPYAASKLMTEQLCIVSHKLHGLPFCCLRLFNVYGPKQNPGSQYSGVISIFIGKALKNEQIQIFGGGSQTRDFIYVKDIVQAFEKAADSSYSGMINIASKEATSIKSLARLIKLQGGSESEIVHKQRKEGDILHSLGSNLKAGKILNWMPQTSLQLGIASTFAWFEQKNLLS